MKGSRAAGRRPRSWRWCWGSRRSRCSASSTRSQNFGPTDGAYASVFCAWTAFYAIAVLATMYWLETQVATELRARRSPAEHGDIGDPDRLIAPGLDACVFFWAYLAGIGAMPT